MKNKKYRPPQRPALAIIGCGKVGTALGTLLARSGWNVGWLYDRDPRRARAARSFIPHARVITRCGQLAGKTGGIIIAVNDDQIRKVAQELARQRCLDKRTVVLHTSGAKGLAELAPLRSVTRSLAALHPIQTFADIKQAMASLPGSYFDAAGNKRAIALIRQMVADLHGRLIIFSDEKKVLAHIAGVLACNYFSTLLYAVTKVFKKIDINSRQALIMQQPLIQSTLVNVLQHGPAQALTGPIARGDESTIALHLAMLKKKMPELLPLYCALGRETVALALEKKSITKATSKKILDLLKKGI